MVATKKRQPGDRALPDATETARISKLIEATMKIASAIEEIAFRCHGELGRDRSFAMADEMTRLQKELGAL